MGFVYSFFCARAILSGLTGLTGFLVIVWSLNLLVFD